MYNFLRDKTNSFSIHLEFSNAVFFLHHSAPSLTKTENKFYFVQLKIWKSHPYLELQLIQKKHYKEIQKLKVCVQHCDFLNSKFLSLGKLLLILGMGLSMTIIKFGLSTQQCNKLVIKPVSYVPINKDIDIK